MLPSISETELYGDDPASLWIGVMQPMTEFLAGFDM